MIKAYFFDWAGTLGKIVEDSKISDLLTKEEYYSMMTGEFERVDFSDDKKRKIVYFNLINARHSLFNDTERVINKLRPNYKIAVVSNMYDITAKQIRSLFSDFLRRFDVVTLSAEVGTEKPSPDIFIHTLHKLNKFYNSNIFLSEVMMIGDKQDKDIEPALNLGMQARLIDRNNQNLIDIIKNAKKQDKNT